MKKAFTITELLAVIVIIAILTVAAISGYNAMGRKSKEKILAQKISQIEAAADRYARENNVNTRVNISVNKLVVLGYLQPDSTNSDGMSVILNPVNNENMICYTVDISVSNDGIKSKFNDKVKNCNISDNETDDTSITITAFSIKDNTTESLSYETNNVLNWTNKNVLLLVTSSYLRSAYSIIYEYGGNNIEKIINDNVTTSVTSPDRVNNYANEIIISDVGAIYNDIVNITVVKKDGTINKKKITVRIDKEAPTGYVLNINNTSINSNSEREVTLYLTDGAGSGVKGFYANTIDAKDEDKFIPKAGSALTGSFDVGNNKGTFLAKRGTYYIYIKDKVGNINSLPIMANVINFDPDVVECDVTLHDLNDIEGTPLTKYKEGWFNKKITIKFKSTIAAGDGGFKWNFVKGKEITNNSELTKIADTGKFAFDKINETEEMDLTTYGGGVLGFTNKNNTLKKCKETFGLDFTKPQIKFNYSENTVIKQQHSIGIEITDNRSGFYPSDGSTKRKVKFNWSPSSYGPGSDWQTVELSISPDSKKLTGTITSNTIKTGGAKLTGEYYLYLQAGDVEDKAQNKLITLTPGVVFKFDNTEPKCTITKTASPSLSGVSISIKCEDKGSLKSDCSSSNPTSDSGLKSDKSYEISDNAGNKTGCSVSIKNYTEVRRASAKTCETSACGTKTCYGSWSSWTRGHCHSSKPSNTRTHEYSCIRPDGYDICGWEAGTGWVCNERTRSSWTCNKECQHKDCGWHDWGSWSTSNSTCNSNTCKSQSRTWYE